MIKKIVRGILKIVNPPKPKIDISEEYIEWLCFANAGMLDRGNLYCFNYAIEHIPSKSPVIEIGSFCGLSTNVINFYMQRHKRKNKLITCDKWIFEGAEHGGNIGHSEIPHTEYRKFVKESYIRNIRMFSSNNLPYTIEVFSDELFNLWKKQERVKDILNRDITLGGKISFCYIDGNHTYEGAKIDFENTDRYLEIGGFILFDDSAENSGFGVTKLMGEIINNGKYELIIKNPNHLFQKRK